ncbi:hypothetical protein AFEL58S_01967 [Afipia felis]
MKRGRLKSVDLLPAIADEARGRAIEAILSRRFSQLDVLRRLNADLMALGLETISHSAFSRWVIDGLEHGFVRCGAAAPALQCDEVRVALGTHWVTFRNVRIEQSPNGYVLLIEHTHDQLRFKKLISRGQP